MRSMNQMSMGSQCIWIYNIFVEESDFILLILGDVTMFLLRYSNILPHQTYTTVIKCYFMITTCQQTLRQTGI